MKVFFKILFGNLWQVIKFIFLGCFFVILYGGGAYLLGNLIAQYFDVRERALYAFLFVLELGITFLIGLSWEEYKEKTQKIR